MAKRKRHMTPERQAEYLAAGRGQGTGADYQPWLKVQDVPSIGRASRIDSWKTGRTHHFMSDIEKYYFFLLEWADSVIDIREQFPLSMDNTLALAKELNIKHPRDPKTKENIVVTTDFCITLVRDNKSFIIARAAKKSGDLLKPRVVEKLKIEELYWLKQGIEWGVITENDLPMVYIRNIEWVRIARWENYVADIDPALITKFSKTFATALEQGGNRRLSLFLEEFDHCLCNEHGIALRLFRHLLARKIIKTDFFKKISVEFPLRNFEINLKDTFLEGDIYAHCN